MCSPREISLTKTGAAGDREMFLIDDDDRLFSVTRSGAQLSAYSRMASNDELVVEFDDGELSGPIVLGPAVLVDFYGSHTVAGQIVEGRWSEAFSARAGTRLRLVKADHDNGGCDAHPVTLLGDASVAELARRSAMEAVDSRRFRMTIDFSGNVPHIEDTWEGRKLALGDAVLRVGGPTPRCNAITRHPDRGDSDLKALRLIKDYRGVANRQLRRSIDFGAYADVITPGTVRLGDSVELL